MERCSIFTKSAEERVTSQITSRNDLADTFRLQIENCFGENILSGHFGSKVEPDLATLYVHKRSWVATSSQPSESFAYERLLHDHFFPISPKYDFPLILITGQEGTGKSTFLRYYFDCYLPYYGRLFQQPSGSQAITPTQFDLSKLLVFYVDLRRSTTYERVKGKMYEAFRNQILSKFPEISVEEDYAMWHRKARWTDPYHADREKSYPGRGAYRAQVAASFFFNDETFVNEALWYLGRQVNRQGEKSFYATLIIDNLDQLSGEVQKELLKLILGLIEDHTDPAPTDSLAQAHNHIWRIIVPLRPETLRNHSNELRPIQRKAVIQLGEPDQSDVIEKRNRRLDQDIRSSNIQVDRELYDLDSDVKIYAPLCSSEAAKQLMGMMNLETFVQANSQGVGIQFTDVATNFRVAFCNSSIRRLLRVRKQIVMSHSVADVVRRVMKKTPTDIAITDYNFFDGLIVDGRAYFDKNDEENDILNLFDTTPEHQPKSAFTLLVGTHLLYLIRRKYYRKSQLIELLSTVGYSEDTLNDSLKLFINKSLFKPSYLESGDDYLIYREDPIVEAFIRLVCSPAYIDNMAIVTPVDEHYLGRMIPTVAYDIGQFKARVMTSLAFLEQIRADERVVSTWRHGHKVSAEVFERVFNSLSLPSIFCKASLEYRFRLEGLRKNPYRLVDVITDRDWEMFLAHDVFNVSTKRANEPLRALTN